MLISVSITQSAETAWNARRYAIKKMINDNIDLFEKVKEKTDEGQMEEINDASDESEDSETDSNEDVM